MSISPAALKATIEALKSTITSPVETVVIHGKYVTVYYASGNVVMEPVHAEPERFPFSCPICDRPHSQSERRGPAHA